MNQKLTGALALISVFVFDAVTAQIPAGNFHVVTGYDQIHSRSNFYMPSFSLKSKPRLNDINLNAVRDFIRRYKMEATDAMWQITSHNDYVARFSVDSIDVIVVYGKSGNWVSSVKRYSENRLPRDVRSVIKRLYPDYSIAHADEVNVSEGKNTVYVITIENAQQIQILNFCNGEIEVKNSFSK